MCTKVLSATDDVQGNLKWQLHSFRALPRFKTFFFLLYFVLGNGYRMERYEILAQVGEILASFCEVKQQPPQNLQNNDGRLNAPFFLTKKTINAE